MRVSVRPDRRPHLTAPLRRTLRPHTYSVTLNRPAYSIPSSRANGGVEGSPGAQRRAIPSDGVFARPRHAVNCRSVRSGKRERLSRSVKGIRARVAVKCASKCLDRPRSALNRSTSPCSSSPHLLGLPLIDLGRRKESHFAAIGCMVES